MKIRKELWFGFILMALIIAGTALMLVMAPKVTNGHLGLMMLALVVVAIMLGFPTAFTLMGMGMIFTWIAYEENTSKTLTLMVQSAFKVMGNDVLISIPLFVFMGYLVERANLIEKLFRSLHLALVRLPGALAVATLWLNQRFVRVDRSRYAALLDVELPEAPAAIDRQGSLWARTRAMLTNADRWREIAWSTLHFPLAVVAGAVVPAVWGSALALVSTPAWIVLAPNDRIAQGGITVHSGAESFAVAGVGLVLAALVAIGLVLARRRRVSLGAKQDKAIEQADKGGYQTKAGFDFSQGGGDTATLEREPVPAPTPTEPVKITRRTRGWVESSVPTPAPSPVTTLSTPAG